MTGSGPPTSTPLVSVITPCLNPGPVLQGCIESVRSQSYPSLEHIVVDGGSTDGTVDVLRRTRGIAWLSEPDDGQAQAINKGFALARGEILTWLCADDRFCADAVGRAVTALVGSDAEWVYGDCEIVERSGSHVRRSRPVLTPELFGQGNPISQPGTFFLTSAFEAVGGLLDESLDLAFDYDLWLRLTVAGAVSVHLPEVLARFTITPGSKTGRNGWAPFLREEARALAKNGAPDIAAFRLGASAALDASREHRVTRRRLRTEIRARASLVPRSYRPILNASALTEATFLELPNPLALRHLFAVAPWRIGGTRRRILFRAQRRLTTMLTGRRPAPPSYPDPPYRMRDADHAA